MHRSNSWLSRATQALDLVGLYRLEGTPELRRRCSQGRARKRFLQLAKILQLQFERTSAGIENLEGGEFLPVLRDPRAKVLHRYLRLLDGLSIEPGVEDVGDSVPVDGLFVLLANFEDATPEWSLEEWRDGLLRELLSRGLHLLVTRIANDAW